MSLIGTRSPRDSPQPNSGESRLIEPPGRALPHSSKSNKSGTQTFWFRRHPTLTLVGVVAVLGPVSLVLLELVVRAIGMPPAFTSPLPPVKSLTVDDSLYTDDAGIFRLNPKWHPDLNADGFRGVEFDEPAAGRPTVMLLGDSFVWGASANPVTERFADRVHRAGYRTINLGVPGAAPNQYAALAQTYIPKIKPDVVIACIYMVNDIHDAAPLIPGHPRYHITNAGWLWGYSCMGPDARPLSAEQAYERVYGGGYWFSYLRHLASQSIVASGLWSRLIGPPVDPWGECDPDFESYPTEELGAISDSAAAVGAGLIVAVIPGSPLVEHVCLDIEPCLDGLAEFDPVVPNGLEVGHYAELPDDHFNNAGHALYAEFLLEQLAGAGFRPGAVAGQSDQGRSPRPATP